MTDEAPSPDLLARYERRGEEAYDKMYDAGRWDSKDYYDDACVNLIRAKNVADALGRREDSARLQARLEHVIAVWNSQFRSTRI